MLTDLQTLMSQGYNIFRVAFAMERLVPNNLSGSYSTAYLANLTASVNYITNKGAYVILDPYVIFPASLFLCFRSKCCMGVVLPSSSESHTNIQLSGTTLGDTTATS
jgi:hypothetical protein